MGIYDWPEQRPPARALAARRRRRHCQTPNCWQSSCASAWRGKSAVTLAGDTLAHFGSLQRLLHADAGEFGQLHGLGPAKYAQLQAVLELARRAVAEQFRREALCSPEAVRHYLRSHFALRTHESFIVLFLDVKNRLINCDDMFRGTLTHTSVYPREVVKAALRRNAASRDAGAQPSVRRGRAQRCGSAAHACADAGAVPGRRPGARPFRGGRATRCIRLPSMGSCDGFATSAPLCHWHKLQRVNRGLPVCIERFAQLLNFLFY